MGVIQRMGLVETDKDDRPLSPVVIHRATAFQGGPPVPGGKAGYLLESSAVNGSDEDEHDSDEQKQ